MTTRKIQFVNGTGKNFTRSYGYVTYDKDNAVFVRGKDLQTDTNRNSKFVRKNHSNVFELSFNMNNDECLMWKVIPADTAAKIGSCSSDSMLSILTEYFPETGFEWACEIAYALSTIRRRG